MTLLDRAFPDPPPANVPASFEARETIERIIDGLRRAGHTEDEARFGAGIAVLEAPFAPPDEESWRRCCARARQVAREGLPVETDRPPVREPVYLPPRPHRPFHQAPPS